ncbi:MAG: neutral/alkaline non-lysosomal ceramidase N-terminal domain-containing protein [Pirellulales bacterium]|nr:neutral/alkaline non-lysosomal ceramidase N-terminal domain-containing protein [Pirellulales bacterium]
MSEHARHATQGQRRIGAAQQDVTPTSAQFLFGYPHVERMSTGVHDPLLAVAMYLDDGAAEALFVAVDIICLTKEQVAEARRGIAEATGISTAHIMITATHTHSGPVTVELLSTTNDAIVPEPDSDYLAVLIQGIIQAAKDAHRSAQPAAIGFAVATAPGIGTNRHDPEGLSMTEVPVLVARSLADEDVICVMSVCSMHPTVLHEDSTLISGDFPAFARQYLQTHGLVADCPILYHMGAAGNQSPRHVTNANTFDEAKRLGEILGKAWEAALNQAEFVSDWTLRLDDTFLELPVRSLPSMQQAKNDLRQASDELDYLQKTGAPRAAVRTAECNWFGAEETLTLATAVEDGRLGNAARDCMPAEIQAIGIGPWTFVGWPGEVFVEFALEVRKHYPNAFIITLANGDLQGYLVTADAVKNKTYEAGNAVFASPDSGELLVANTLELLKDSSTSKAVPCAQNVRVAEA